MSRWLKYIILTLLFLLLAVLPFARQSENGSVTGTVTGVAAPVPGALVEAWELRTGKVTPARAGSNGDYTLRELTPGRYYLWISADGYRPIWSGDLTVERGGVARQDVKLKAGRSVD
jgi:hypothetical protein